MMPFPRLLMLALCSLQRDARSGELRVLFFALLIAVAASTAIGYFSARLNAAMLLRATEFLGADIVLSGTTAPNPEQIERGLRLGLEHVPMVEFSSVIASDNGIQLASVKAVGNGYPLRGEVKSSAALYQPSQSGGQPAAGEAWAEARLFVALGLTPGDSIEVGSKALKLTRVLTYEPDSAGDFYSFNPRILMHIEDLAATEIVQPGSRVRWKALWRGSPEALKQWQEQVASELLPSQRIQDARGGNQQIGGALQRAERYLNLASLAAVLLAGVAVALSAARFASRRLDTSALLRCLGLSRRETLALFALQLGLLGVTAALIGAVVGWLGQLGLFALLKGLLPADLPAAGLWPALAGMMSGLIALAGFALSPLLGLGRVPPLRVLRRDLLPLPPAAWLVYGSALLALALIMWRMSLDLKLTLSLLAGGLLAALLLGALLLSSLRGLRHLLATAALPWRLGLGQLLRHPLSAAGQSLAFGLILLAMALIVLLRSELLDTWQAQLPDNAPNLFALNIVPEQRDAFAHRLAELSPRAAPLYPVVPGRLVAINGQAIAELLEQDKPDSQGRRAIRRDLALTWSSELPESNPLVAGSWWNDAPSGELPRVSVESTLAESLHLNLGDRLRVNIGGDEREAVLSSLRKVQWDNFQPNFYLIFEPDSLSGLPVTYMTSFYLPAQQDKTLVELARQFPTVTLVQVDALLAQLRQILAQVSLAVEYVLLFVLAAGIAVLLAGLNATLDERIRQAALLRVLGAKRELLNQARLREFALLGLSSGLLAALGCELVSFLLYRYAFDLPWQAHPWLLLLPLLGAILVSMAGLLGTRRALSASPLTLLREL
nr:FtsX-like permease family protein [Ventosimonas gracilis]